MAQAYGSAFAQLYDRQLTAFAQEVAPSIYKFYLSQQRTPIYGKKLLDLCCGTGQLARFFLQHGFTVTGVDLSAPMLALARQNAGDYLTGGSATFLHADATNFTIADSFDLVVSTYDALNHLSDLTALRGCLNSVAEVTADGGYFIFDLNTRQGIRRWNGIMINETEDGLVIQRGIYGGGDRAHTLITGFVPNDEPGQFTRFEEYVYNTIFNLTDVEDLLLETGWSKVHFARLSHLEEPVHTPEQESRISSSRPVRPSAEESGRMSFSGHMRRSILDSGAQMALRPQGGRRGCQNRRVEPIRSAWYPGRHSVRVRVPEMSPSRVAAAHKF